MKTRKFSVVLCVVVLLTAIAFDGCRKGQFDPATEVNQGAIALDSYSEELVEELLEQFEEGEITEKELLGALLNAGPLDDEALEEIVEFDEPALSDNTVQLALLANAPFDDEVSEEAIEARGFVLQRDLADNINLNDLPNIELNKANFLIEALANLKHGRGQDEFDEFVILKDTIDVFGTFQSGQYFVLAPEILARIGEIDLSCTGGMGGITQPCISKHIVAVDLEVLTSQVPGGDKTFKVAVNIGIGLLLYTPPQVDCDFGSTDHWRYHFGLICNGGKCCPVGPCPSDPCIDATDKLEQNINRCRFVPNCKFFVNPSTVFLMNDFNPNDPVPGDNDVDFLMFSRRSDVVPYTECIDPTQMNFYKNGVQQLAALPFNKPTGLVIEIGGYDLTPNFIIGLPDFRVHECTVIYGECVNIPLAQ